MNTQTKKVLDFLENTLNNLPELNRDDMNTTVSTLDSILFRYFDEKTKHRQDLNIISKELSSLVFYKEDTSFGWSLDDIKDWYKTLLKSIIFELKLLELPSEKDKKIDKSIKVNVKQIQSQEQTQKQSLNIFIESIKNELSESQLKEIKEIISKESDIERTKSKILDKVKEFGLSVCASILSNIITNPSILNGIK